MSSFRTWQKTWFEVHVFGPRALFPWFCDTFLFDGSQWFQTERKILPFNLRGEAQLAVRLAGAAINLKRTGGTAMQLIAMAKQNDVVGPLAAADMAVRGRPQDAAFGHEQDGIGRRLRLVMAQDVQAGGGAE